MIISQPLLNIEFRLWYLSDSNIIVSVFMHTVDLLGFILGITFGALVLGLGCPLCIILGICICVAVAFHRHKRRERELRSKNITITTGGFLNGTQQATPVSSTVQYTAQEEKVQNIV